MKSGILVLMLLAADAGMPPDAARKTPEPTAAPPVSAAAVVAMWAARREPSAGVAQAIGSYSSGCLQGAAVMPPAGAGYELLHPERHRNFAHPDLIAYIRRLAKATKQKRLGLLGVGDLSQARGGPTPSGHRSHQSGLDVDVAYGEPARANAAAAREGAAVPVVVDLRTHRMTASWTAKTMKLLEIAASDPSVDRIFVNPAVKRELCAGAMRSASWLARIRPWYAHHDHFHVRLKCPAGSPQCQPPEPLPMPGGDPNGCGASLAWWFSDEATKARPPAAEAVQGITLPDACAGVLAAASAPPPARRQKAVSTR